MKKCSNCNKELKDNVKFCTRCGVKLQGEDYSGEKSQISVKTRIAIVLVVIALAVSLISVNDILSFYEKDVIETAEEYSEEEAETTEDENNSQIESENTNDISIQNDNTTERDYNIVYKLMQGNYTNGNNSSLYIECQIDVTGEVYGVMSDSMEGMAWLTDLGNGTYAGEWYSDTDAVHLTDITLTTNEYGFRVSTKNTIGSMTFIDECWNCQFYYEDGVMTEVDNTDSYDTEGDAHTYFVNVKEGTYLALRSSPETNDYNIEGELYNGETVQVDSYDGQFWYVYSPKLNQWGYVNSDYLK